MAEVTVNSVKHNVIGSVKQKLYNVTGATGSTLTVGLANVHMVVGEGTALTAYSVAAGSVPGTSVITLTGTMSTTDLEVIGT
jgi:hypothetical protein